MTGCRHEKTIERRTDFKGMKDLVALLERIGEQDNCKKDWARRFALSILEFAAEKGFDKATFRIEQNQLEGIELRAVLKQGFSDPGKTMNALRLWEGNENILLKIKEEGAIVYSSDHTELTFILSQYEKFHELWEALEAFVEQPFLNGLLLVEPVFKA